MLSSGDAPEGYVITSISLPKELDSVLEIIAKEKHASKSEILRVGLGLYIKHVLQAQEPPLAGIFVDGSGVQVFVGLATDETKEKVKKGEWKLLKTF